MRKAIKIFSTYFCPITRFANSVIASDRSSRRHINISHTMFQSHCKVKHYKLKTCYFSHPIQFQFTTD